MEDDTPYINHSYFLDDNGRVRPRLLGLHIVTKVDVDNGEITELVAILKWIENSLPGAYRRYVLMSHYFKHYQIGYYETPPVLFSYSLDEI